MSEDFPVDAKKQPFVTIITSTFNRAEIVRLAIQSVKDQTFSNWQMCVIGDCTPDHTGDVVASFNDPRIEYFNLGVKSPPRSHGSLAKNHGLQKMAKGEWIAYLDDDDQYLPDYLEKMVAFIRRTPNAQFVYCRCRYLDKKSGKRILGNPFQRWLHGYSKEKLKRYNFIDTDCVMHKRALLEKVGYWDPSFYFDDYELWLRMSEACDFHHLNLALVNKFVDEPPFLVRAFRKGMQILRHGRTTPLE